MEKLSNLGKSWGGCASLLSVSIAIAAFLGFGTYFYNQIWQSKVLTYTTLPSYDLGDQSFNGVVIENRGQVPLTDVQIIFSDFSSNIVKINMPGAHEPATIVNGGTGSKEVTIEVKRFSKGSSLSIYMLTAGTINLEESKTFFVASNETKAVPSSSPQNTHTVDYLMIAVFGSTLLIYFIKVLYGSFNRIKHNLST